MRTALLLAILLCSAGCQLTSVFLMRNLTNGGVVVMSDSQEVTIGSHAEGEVRYPTRTYLLRVNASGTEMVYDVPLMPDNAYWTSGLAKEYCRIALLSNGLIVAYTADMHEPSVTTNAQPKGFPLTPRAGYAH